MNSSPGSTPVRAAVMPILYCVFDTVRLAVVENDADFGGEPVHLAA